MEYHTTDMSFGAYLLTTKKLRFIRIDPVTPLAKIVFDDPQQIGHQLEIDFTNGAEAPAAEFHSKLRHLRRKLDAAIHPVKSRRFLEDRNA